MMRLKSHAGLFAVALLLATASIAAAQEFRATVRGQILDTSKGALPGATVSMTNTETNEVATAVTNADGNYTIPFLRPGSYRMKMHTYTVKTHTGTPVRRAELDAARRIVRPILTGSRVRSVGPVVGARS